MCTIIAEVEKRVTMGCHLEFRTTAYQGSSGLGIEPCDAESSWEGKPHGKGSQPRPQSETADIG